MLASKDGKLMYMQELFGNIVLWSAVSGLVSAQILKPIIHLVLRKGWDWHLLLTTGGMPSSHTSAVIAMTVSIAMTEGLSSPLFAFAVIFSLITMSDATNVRYETGKQAELLNQWSELLSEIHKNGPFSPQNLKTMIGHSGLQVAAGLVLGLAVGTASTLLMTNA